MTVQDILNTVKGLRPDTPVKLVIANDPEGVEALHLLGIEYCGEEDRLAILIDVDMDGEEEDWDEEEEDWDEEEEEIVPL